eukprot:2333740-Pyramimonas_sp.AAC.1
MSGGPRGEMPPARVLLAIRSQRRPPPDNSSYSGLMGPRSDDIYRIPMTRPDYVSPIVRGPPPETPIANHSQTRLCWRRRCDEDDADD